MKHTLSVVVAFLLAELTMADRRQKREIRQLEQELHKWQVLVDSITGEKRLQRPPCSGKSSQRILKGLSWKPSLDNGSGINGGVVFPLNPDPWAGTGFAAPLGTDPRKRWAKHVKLHLHMRGIRLGRRKSSPSPPSPPSTAGPWSRKDWGDGWYK